MESNSLRSSPPAPEDHLGVVNRTIHGESNKVAQEVKPPPKASCKHNNTTGEEEEEDEDGGFSWPPPRSYTCGFCKRNFRSAQALGGHMNVHRRDRAKLRRSPPLDHHHSHQRNTKLIIPSPCSSASTDQMKKWDPTTLHGPSSAEPIKFLKLSTFSGFNGETSDGGCKIWKKVKNLVRMEKEINLLSGSNDVDLELRLGF